MDLRFWKMCPSGNTTILIAEPTIPPSQRAHIASVLMNPLHLHAEQVGYINLEANPPRLEMMGGEFCGNACRSLAAVLAMTAMQKTRSSSEESYEGTMLSSGVEQPIAYRVHWEQNGTAQILHAAIRMPLDTMPTISFCTIEDKQVPIVHLSGISHLLLNKAEHQEPKEHASKKAHAILAEHELLDCVAAGCIWYDYNATTRQCSIVPFVHVRETQSLYAETACGSGTLAVALYLAGQEHGQNATRPFTLQVLQPSGMCIEAHCGMAPQKHNAQNGMEAWIGGPVLCIAHGTTFIHDMA